MAGQGVRFDVVQYKKHKVGQQTDLDCLAQKEELGKKTLTKVEQDLLAAEQRYHAAAATFNSAHGAVQALSLQINEGMEQLSPRQQKQVKETIETQQAGLDASALIERFREKQKEVFDAFFQCEQAKLHLVTAERQAKASAAVYAMYTETKEWWEEQIEKYCEEKKTLAEKQHRREEDLKKRMEDNTRRLEGVRSQKAAAEQKKKMIAWEARTLGKPFVQLPQKQRNHGAVAVAATDANPFMKLGKAGTGGGVEFPQAAAAGSGRAGKEGREKGGTEKGGKKSKHRERAE
uniref:Uncharacterized protein n=1 Tax=Chromera velia CCMP2878 TaxID=1169474 RepID=A0A0G4F7T5_9ALVE|eukprot:Cvel_15661.t1-p1 / transcript=Cvel_15661.t1 / gene=Cvel_15661 / organism=Chromera_velia_CCMP2878 / gene_product=hypothetical protein / transcript_product=hypothetical protein / location=Cvel_scaffold1169:13816-16788(+) / protein_length=289 / sequence_SO=supercontig / SO=protein_coding / is_pseudo=false